MSQPATLAWFARHEVGLVWRDFVAMMTAGRRRRGVALAVAICVFALIAHGFAFAILWPVTRSGIVPDKQTLVAVTGGLLLGGSMMLSQAMESVTRAFYTRADLDLILTSPASSRRLFAVRMGAIALGTAMVATTVAGPFINVMMLLDGARWAACYGVIAAIGAASAAIALSATVALFRTIGPKRTRLIAQIAAALVGAAFVIGVQVTAILSVGEISRLSLLRSKGVMAMTPDLDSALWLPARAAMGGGAELAVVLCAGLALLAAVIAATSPRFGDHVVAASGTAFGTGVGRPRAAGFRPGSARRVLRRKEWALLARDPWLMSQTLMQVFYLLPPALLLWVNFGGQAGTLLILVPVLVMAGGQLAGGLAWLAISGEDAPDLVATAPVVRGAIILAKIEAVLIAVMAVTTPLVIALAFASPRLALWAALGIAVAAGSATTIQIWFRAQARRSLFRRRHTSSRVATIAEALASIMWAGAATMAAVGTWAALAPVILVVLVLGGTRLVRPRPVT